MYSMNGSPWLPGTGANCVKTTVLNEYNITKEKINYIFVFFIYNTTFRFDF